MRRLLLAVLVLGICGLAAELVLLEHFDERAQWAPLTALGAGLLGALAVAWRPSRGTVRAFQIVMALSVVVGLVGVGFHVQSNFEFEREIDAQVGGAAGLWLALHGAVPALAPGALVQLGLVGLVFCWRHPALERTRSSRPQPSEEITP